MSNATELAEAMLPPGQKTFTGKEFAALAGILEQTAAAWRSKRVGPAFIKSGRKAVYPRASLVDYFAKNAVVPVAQ